MFNNTTTLNPCNQSLDHFQYQPPSVLDKLTGVTMILIIAISLAGNILVCYAFVRNPRLRIVTNYFIMNLAISDILTASLVMTFDADIKLNGLSSWKYGVAMCKVWTTAYTISVPTSILTLCVVSIDRYQAISDPLGYRAGINLNPTKAICLISSIWALSFFMAFLPLIVGSPLNETLSRDLPRDCGNVYFCYFDISPSYTAVVTIIAFILPSVVMVILYAKMYIIITYKRYVFDESTIGNEITGNNEENNNARKRTESNKTGSRRSGSNDRSRRNGSDARGSQSVFHPRSHQTAYQAKVARHFSVIVLVQLLCWYPYSVASLVYNLCDDCEHISSSALYVLLTIGYMSCAINPYLYAYQQRSFRQVFNRMLGVKV